MGKPSDGISDIADNSCSLTAGGCPVWKVNPANLNLYIYDIPLWYSTPYGPDVIFKLSYNSQSALAQNEIFGNKWTFSYGSHIVEDPGKTATAFMPDGARIVFTNNGNGGFASAYATAATLEKLSGQEYRLTYPSGMVYYYTIPAGTNSQQTFLTKIEDLNGQSLTLHYNQQVQLTTIKDAQGRETSLTYNAEGRVSKVTDPFGRHASFTYSADGDLVSITDMAGYQSTLAYDANKYITTINKPQGEWKFTIEPAVNTRNNYDPYPPPGGVMWADYRITITEPSGERSEYHYNGYSSYSWYVSPKDYVAYQSSSVNNYRSAAKTIFKYRSVQGTSRLSTLTNPDNSTRSFDFNNAGMLTSARDENGHTTTYAYNSARQQTEERRGERQISYQYLNGHSQLPTQIVLPGADGNPLTITYSYDAKNNPVSIISSDGSNTRAWHYRYNDKGQIIEIDGPRNDVADMTKLAYHSCSNTNDCGRLSSVTNAIGERTTFDQYREGGLVGRIRYANGLVSTYSYDRLGRITAVEQRDGLQSLGTTRYEYAAPQQGPSKIIFADGVTLSNSYDANNLLVSTTDNSGNRVTYTRDANGNIIERSVFDQGGQLNEKIRFQYNQRNWLSAILGSSGNNKLQYSYDRVGNLTGITDALGNSDTKRYNPYNEVQENQDAAGGQTRYTYSKGGELTSVIDALGRTTQYHYNTFGDLIRIDSPDTGTTTYTYDEAGNRISQTDARGITVTYHYDALNRLTAVEYPDSSENLHYNYGQAAQKRITVTDQDGESEYRYNGLGQMISHTRRQHGQTYRSEYRYNQAGRLTEVIYPSGRHVKYTYNASGRVSKVQNAQLVPFYQTIADNIYYQGNGKIKVLRYGNNRVQLRRYNEDGLLTGIDYPDEQQRYSYTARDNISRIERSGQVENFTYDTLQRLSGASGSYGTLSYRYDAIGNRLEETHDGLIRSYHYDGQNRLTEVTESGSASTPPAVSEPVRNINWNTTLGDKRGNIGQSELLHCPGNGRLKAIWGTGTYTDLSPVCSAAVHAGLIDLQNGGTFRATIEAGQSRYRGSTQNGVTSHSYYAYWFGSYRLSAAQTQSGAQQPVNMTLSYDAAGNIVN